jgi:hypothetical protein
VAHRKAAQDFGEGLPRPASYHQEEVRGQYCSGQQTHGSPHIHWHYAKHSQEKARGNGVLLLQRRHRTLRQRHKAKVGTIEEILDFESADFQLPQRRVISPRRLFGTEELPFNLASFPTPASADDCPKTRSGKSIRRNNNAPNTKQANNCASALTLKG